MFIDVTKYRDYTQDPNNKYDFLDYNKKVNDYIDKYGIGDINTVDNLDSFRKFLKLEEMLFKMSGSNLNFYYYWLPPFIDSDPEPYFYNIQKFHEKNNIDLEQVIYLKSLHWYEDPLLNYVKNLEPKWLWLDLVDSEYYRFSLFYLSNYKNPIDFDLNNLIVKFNLIVDRLFNYFIYNNYFELKLILFNILDTSYIFIVQNICFPFLILLYLNTFFDYYDFFDFIIFIALDVLILYFFYKLFIYLFKF